LAFLLGVTVSHLNTVVSVLTGILSALWTQTSALGQLLIEADAGEIRITHPMAWLLCLLSAGIALHRLRFILLPPPLDPNPDEATPAHTSRRFQRYMKHAHARNNRRRRKGVSIKDVGYHRQYPRHLRSACTFYKHPPSLHDQELLGTMHNWYHHSNTHRSGHTRLTQFMPNPVQRRKGGKPMGAKHRDRRSPFKRVTPINMPPNVHRVTHGCFTRPNKWQTEYSKWVHHHAHSKATHPMACPCDKKPCIDTDHVHSIEKCVDSFGRNACMYPMDCPHGKQPSSDNVNTQQLLQQLLGTVDIPNQQELDQFAASYKQRCQQEAEEEFDKKVAMYACGGPLTTVIMAPHKLAAAMAKDSAFDLVWDSGASHCITNNENDFDGKESRPGWMAKTLQGLGMGLKVKGVGTVSWTVLDTHGNPRTLKLPAYYVPDSPARLLSLPQLLQKYPGETIQMTDQMAVLSGVEGDDTRTEVQALFNPSNNLPTTPAYRLDDMQQAAMAFNAMVAVVDPRNLNLTAAEKELLRHHQKLAHLDIRRVQFLLRTGVLATSAAQRALHTQASKIRDPPKCAACQFGKQTVRAPKTKTTTMVIKDALPILPQTHSKFPGETISIDHFVCSQKGVTLTSRGGVNAPGYTGGSLLHDNATGFIHVEFHQHLNTHETLDGIKNFEAMCLDLGVVPTKYTSDSGSAFTSKEFKEHLQTFTQIVRFAGTGAHHHNPYAERSIRTIMSMARTMMLHAAAYWPDMADATLWPLAVQYAVFIYNRVPNPETGLSPQRHLRDLHVWGCPAYTLDKRLADGKKITRWATRSVRSIFVGISGEHLSNTPQVLNTTTRAITTPYHVVFDDWFHTVGSDQDSIPDFNTPEWAEMFGDSVYQYMPDSNWPHMGASPYQDIPSMDPRDPIFDRRERVQERMFQHFHPDPVVSGQPNPSQFPAPAQYTGPWRDYVAQRETIPRANDEIPHLNSNNPQPMVPQQNPQPIPALQVPQPEPIQQMANHQKVQPL
jgi:hypothetical protein